MKKIYRLFLLFFLFFQQNIYAQNAEGCDGVRYYYDVFNTISKTTEQYGANSTAAGNMVNLQMDVFQPAGDTAEKRPLMIWAHGGAFLTGERAEMDTLCYLFAKKGFVTASISYRLYPLLALGIPDSVDMMDAAIRAIGDMRAVVRYFRKDADTVNKYRIDPDHIYVGGASAGAIMAVQVGYLDGTDSIPDYFSDVLAANGGIEGNTGDVANQSYSSEVHGVINLAGAIHRLDWIEADDVPIISYHGDEDDVVPYGFGYTNVLGFDFMSVNGSGSIHNYIEPLGIPNFLVTAVGATHETAFGSAYESYLNGFINEGRVFLHNLLCEGIAIDVNELLPEGEIQAFPNPSKDVIALALDHVKKTYDLLVYDATGRPVFQDRQQNGKTYLLEKAKIGQGLFFVTIKTVDGTEVLKIVFE